MKNKNKKTYETVIRGKWIYGKIGQMVYCKDGMGGQVSQINRTTKRICGICIGNNLFWRYLKIKRPENAISFGNCGVCGEYHIVERMEFVK